MSAPERTESRLKRVAFEVAVIVGSILTAFAIDAAWAEREERTQEAALLSSLATDFEASRLNLEAALRLHRRTRDAADRLMRVRDPAALAAADQDSLRLAVAWLAVSVPSFDPATGTLDVLLNSGRADVISDPQLMTELTRWTAVVDDFVEGEEQAIRHTFETLYPALAARINLRDVLSSGLGPEVSRRWEGPAGNPASYDFLLEDEIQGMLMQHWWLHENAIEAEAPVVEDAIQRISSLLHDSGW